MCALALTWFVCVRQRTVMVTNQLHFLNRCDYVYVRRTPPNTLTHTHGLPLTRRRPLCPAHQVLEAGAVVEHGTFANLMDKGLDFASLIRANVVGEDEDGEEAEEGEAGDRERAPSSAGPRSGSVDVDNIDVEAMGTHTTGPTCRCSSCTASHHLSTCSPRNRC